MNNSKHEEPLTKEQLVEQFRRSEILKAARKVFAEQGYSKATIDIIAERAGIAKGTIYLYFRNKEELFLQTSEERLKKMLEGLQKILKETGEPLQKIKNSITFTFRFMDEDKDFYRIFNAAVMESRIRELPSYIKNVMGYLQDYFNAITPVLKEAVNSGILIKMDPIKMAFILGGIIDSLMHYHLLIDTSEPFSADEDLAYEIFLNGFLRKEK